MVVLQVLAPKISTSANRKNDLILESENISNVRIWLQKKKSMNVLTSLGFFFLIFFSSFRAPQ